MKHTKHLMLSFAVAAATVTLVSCSDDNAVINPAEAEENEKVTALTAITNHFIVVRCHYTAFGEFFQAPQNLFLLTIDKTAKLY